MSANRIGPAMVAAALWGCGDYTPIGEVVDPSLVLKWSDEFDGAAGSAPDATHWTFDVGGDGWGNNQLEFDTDRRENAALDGSGHLAIVARAETMDKRSYTSARMKTKDKFTHQYGRLEARIKLPAGRGMWPAFWALGDDIDRVAWPACGEIDVMENSGAEPSITHGSLHGPGYSGGGAITRSYALDNGARFSDDFHVFALDWSEQGMRWLVDGIPYSTQLRTVIAAGKTWAFDHPFFLLLNLAVGGTFSGNPDASTVFPQTMLVDYVRAYDRK